MLFMLTILLLTLAISLIRRSDLMVIIGIIISAAASGFLYSLYIVYFYYISLQYSEFILSIAICEGLFFAWPLMRFLEHYKRLNLLTVLAIGILSSLSFDFFVQILSVFNHSESFSVDGVNFIINGYKTYYWWKSFITDIVELLPFGALSGFLFYYWLYFIKSDFLSDRPLDRS